MIEQESHHRSVFITGPLRTGTTMVLHGIQPGRARRFSQPLLPIFCTAKQIYYSQRSLLHGFRRMYPINDMFLDNYHSHQDFDEFLSNYLLSTDDLRHFHSSTDNIQCRNAQALIRRCLGNKPVTFLELLNSICEQMSSGGSDITVIKENIGEEFIPSFQKLGITCVLTCRDPRTYIVSLTTGRFKDYVGARRPMLFWLRYWRKAVHWFIRNNKCSLVNCLRYEDVAGRDDVGISMKDQGRLPLDASQESYMNSSQPDAMKDGNDRMNALSPKNKRWISAVCFPEMVAIGYDVGLDLLEARQALEDGPLGDSSERSDAVGYLWSAERKDEELKRLERYVYRNICSEWHLPQELYGGLGQRGPYIK